MRVVGGGILCAGAVVAACAPTAQQPPGAVGEERAVVFQAENDVILAPTTRLSVGSAFDVQAVARADAELDGAVFKSDDDAVLKVLAADVGEGRVEVVGGGAAFLEVRAADGAPIDRIEVRAAVPLRTALVEAQLLGAVDARIPGEAALVLDEELDVYVAATDRCGGDLLDQGASSIASSDAAVVEVVAEASGRFVLRPLATGDAVLTLTSPGLEDAAWDLKVVTPELVDDVVPTAAAASGSSVTLWGRAFTGSTEVVGLTYAWSATNRVRLSVARGAVTTATIEGVNGDGADGGEVVTGDAKVTAESAGEEGELDLLALRDVDLVATRVGAAADDPPPQDVAQTGGCTGRAPAVCDPTAAAAVVGISAARRLSKRRRAAGRA